MSLPDVRYAEFVQTTNPDEADIDIWIKDFGPGQTPWVAHFSRKYNDEGLWESKMGPGVRIIHPRNALAGGYYGNMGDVHYRVLRPPSGVIFQSPSPKPDLDRVATELRNIFPNLAAAFDIAYDKWIEVLPDVTPNAEDVYAYVFFCWNFSQ